jgi:hypothetical protein
MSEQSTSTQDRVHAIADLLKEASETHHTVFKIVDGVDDDWASWYSDWLLHLSKLPSLLDKPPVRSELTYMLVRLNKDYTSQHPSDTWPIFYARGLLEHFA